MYGRSNGQGFTHYRCSFAGKNRRWEGPRCDNRKCFRVDEVDAVVWNEIEKILCHPDILKDIVRSSEKEEKRPELEARIEEMEKDLRQKHEEEEKVVRLFRKGMLSERLLESQLQEIELERQVLLKEKQSLETRLTTLTMSQKELRSLEEQIEILGQALPEIDFEAKRDLLRGFIGEGKIILHEDGRIEMYVNSDLKAVNWVSDEFTSEKSIE